MAKIRIAQIGVGHDHADNVFETLLAMPDVYEVVGYAAPDQEGRRFSRLLETVPRWKEVPRLTVEEILSDPTITAVAVETEEEKLVEYGQMVADAGKHLHMDKPGGLDADAFERLAKTLKEKNLVFSLGYMYRHNPYILELYEDLKQGGLGEVFSVEAHMNCSHVTEKKQWLSRFPGGMMFYLGCHLVDFVFRILGKPLDVTPFNCSTGLEGVTAEDFGMAVLRYPNGVSFVKTCATELGGFARRQLVVCGTKKTVEIKPLEMPCEGGGQHTKRTVRDTPVWANEGIISYSEPEGRYDRMMNFFAEMVRGEKENPYSYEYEVELFRLVLHCCGLDVDYKKEIRL